MNELAGRCAMITGAGSGIGRAASLRFARAGAALCLTDSNATAAHDVARSIQAGGGRAIALAADVTRRSEVEAAVQAAEAAFGPPDILLHSAGIGLERPFLETGADEWQRLIDVDLTGTFHVCQAVARSMVQNGGGRIVTIASTAGVRGGSGRAAYGAAKAGVIGLTRAMAVELALHGIGVNCLAPGAIETELVQRMHSAETRIVYRAGIPMDRYGTPEEVAEAALFLAGEASAYITGHVLGVDGGFLAAGVMHRRQATGDEGAALAGTD
ncbi:SDR family oxidoreductase [Sandaracinobacter sp. RS1-74]|uniref:SDR family NAD(P)-dependent oxidoreductase n=1 Tax=Sandaracinobacteroides sayramensis TaxID=2913411 RepID=UPI001EDAA33D|nr:SDR family NAD(P)-dependent oxidoreductase [Sandaracinobacteroides sayramensis]MCG2840631.1 SDR family oxidoreductase [Sandaracinobacteroides sayramensis]